MEHIIITETNEVVYLDEKGKLQKCDKNDFDAIQKEKNDYEKLSKVNFFITVKQEKGVTKSGYPMTHHKQIMKQISKLSDVDLQLDYITRYNELRMSILKNGN